MFLPFTLLFVGVGWCQCGPASYPKSPHITIMPGSGPCSSFGFVAAAREGIEGSLFSDRRASTVAVAVAVRV